MEETICIETQVPKALIGKIRQNSETVYRIIRCAEV